MDRAFIIAEIQRTARENGGKPLDKARFESVTGIRVADWLGIYWARWGHAIEQAGLARNAMNPSYEAEELLRQLAALIRELGRFPVSAELKMTARKNPKFPSDKTYYKRWKTSALVKATIEFCETRDGFEDVLAICRDKLAKSTTPERNGDPDLRSRNDKSWAIGSVYLLKSGRRFKIGRAEAIGRRECEPSIQLPEKPRLVHEIRTDDPIGIERYWRQRFADKRLSGEWFNLTAEDANTFRRRKFM